MKVFCEAGAIQLYANEASVSPPCPARNTNNHTRLHVIKQQKVAAGPTLPQTLWQLHLLNVVRRKAVIRINPHMDRLSLGSTELKIWTYCSAVQRSITENRKEV